MTPDKDAEIARLREQLRLANIDAANLEAERNDLARKLGAEVATTQRMRAALRLCSGVITELGSKYTVDKYGPDTQIKKTGCGCCDIYRGSTAEHVPCRAHAAIDAALASGNGDGK